MLVVTICLIDMVRQGLMTSKTNNITKDAVCVVQIRGSDSPSVKDHSKRVVYRI